MANSNMNNNPELPGHAIAIRLFNPEDQSILYFDEDPHGHSLTCEITNVSERALTVPKGEGEAGSANYHFALCFRKGILASEKAEKPGDPPKFNISSASAENWKVSDPTIENDRIVFYFLNIGDNNPFEDGPVSLKLKGVRANAKNGTRTTNVELLYRNISYTESHEGALNGTRLHLLNIINHLGHKISPLRIEWIGNHQVLNDGSEQILEMHIINTQKDREVVFKENSRLVFSFDEHSNDSTQQIVAKSNDIRFFSVKPINKNHFNTEALEKLKSKTSKALNLCERDSPVIHLEKEQNLNFNIGAIKKLIDNIEKEVLETRIVTDIKHCVESVYNNLSFLERLFISEKSYGPWVINLEKRIPGLKMLHYNTVELKKLIENIEATAALEFGDARKAVRELKSFTIKPKESFSVWVTIKTKKPAGIAHLQIMQEDLPGFWNHTFVLPVGKSPIITNEHKVGIGKKPSEDKLEVNGSIQTESAFIGTGHWKKTHAAFGHKKHAKGEKTYAVLQRDTGDTFLNAAPGKSLLLRVGNESKMIITSEGVNVKGDVNISGKLKENGNDLLPAGAIIMWTGDKAPDGWVLCDGGKSIDDEELKEKVEKKELVIPDLRERFVVGMGNNPNIKKTKELKLNETGGNEENQLIIPEHKTKKDGKHIHYNSIPSKKVKVATAGLELKEIEVLTGQSSKTISYHPEGSNLIYYELHKHIIPKQQINFEDTTDHLPPYYSLAFIMKL